MYITMRICTFIAPTPSLRYKLSHTNGNMRSCSTEIWSFLIKVTSLHVHHITLETENT